MPISLVGGEFIPNKDGYWDEMKRLERTIGRYTVGFRHYENYYYYKMKFPDATMEEYAKDINS